MSAGQERYKPQPTIPALARFAAARSHFMAALDAMLTDPAVSDLSASYEVDGSISMIQQLEWLRRGSDAG